MSCQSITVDPNALEPSTAVAVLRCLAEPLCLPDLIAAVAAAPATATRIVLAPPDATPAELVAVASPGGVVATARPVTDALKRVEAGRVVTTVDRDQFFRAGLPIGLPRRELTHHLAALAGRYAQVGELFAEGEVRFVPARPHSQ